MVMQTQMQRIGLNPFFTFYIDAMLKVDGDANADANVKSEHVFTVETKNRDVLQKTLSVNKA